MQSSKCSLSSFRGRAPGKRRGNSTKSSFGSFGAMALLALLGTGAAHAQSKQTPARVLDGSAKLVQHYDANQTLRLAFSLKPPHWEEEQKLIEQLHDKKSPLFHKFLTAEQFNARFAPSAADEQAVIDWAESVGLKITNRFANRMVVDAEAPAGVIEKALGLTINQYRLGGTTYFSNDRDPVLPGRLASVVQGVEGLNSFERQVPASRHGVHTVLPDYTPGPASVVGEAARANASPNFTNKESNKTGVQPELTGGGFDPQDMYSSQGYDFGALSNQGHCCNPLNNPGNSPPASSIALATFGDVNYADIAGFQAQFSYLAYYVQKIGIDGGYSCGTGFNDNCLEATLDTEWSLSMANSFGGYGNTAKVYVYESSGSGSDMYNQMLTDGYARVFSTSWGCSDGVGCSAAYMASIDSIFAAMVAQGWSLVAAAGDQGATGSCSNYLDVSFPASDPNVVAVGGTSLIFYSNDTFDYEVAWTGGTSTGSCSNNDGGGTGGFSSYFGVPSYQSSLAASNGWTNRAVPDISLNSGGIGQQVYYNGGFSNWEGTSIAAPEMAGFFAQENAYLLAIGNACGSGTSACAPLGNPNYSLYGGSLQTTAAHYPFYDIVSGCNSNDITALYGLGYYCAVAGYDLVTGWGSANMLQLAWGINWSVAASSAGPSVSYSGPTPGVWYNSNRIVSWSVNDNASSGDAPTGIAGFTQGWDSIPNDSHSEATQGSGDSFYTGPQFVNATGGCLSLTGAGGCAGGVSQGCHTANVRAWNNMGVTSGVSTYGPVCYDSIAPATTAKLSGTLNGAAYATPVKITLTATDNASGVAATFYSVDLVGTFAYSAPFTVSTPGKHTLHYWSTDVAGNSETTEITTFTIQATGNYLGSDTTSEGTWTNKYGSQGEIIAKGLNSPPAYATVSLTGDTAYAWAASTTDPRALQTSSGASTRIASTFYSSSTEKINLNLTDGNTHKIALYLLDWDGTSRVETISIVDANTLAVLSTQTFSSFHNGVYAEWNIAGNVQFQITKTGGPNAVVSGIFFDPPDTASATYLGADATTNGTWTGKYGSVGQIIAKDLTSPPAYATVSFTGDTAYTWVASTSDTRALQTSSGSSTRIASTFYSGTTETINVNITDGNTHKISLYLLDWDGNSRAETITVFDAVSHASLSSESFSAFHTGEYAEWNISGNVQIQISKTGGSNAVVSGIFFD